MGLREWRERNGARLRRRFKVKLEHSSSFTVDVAARGLCVELLRVLAPGTPVKGTLQVRCTDVPFAGRVIWAKSGDAYLGLRGRMGVAFTSVAPEYAELFSAESARGQAAADLGRGVRAGPPSSPGGAGRQGG